MYVIIKLLNNFTCVKKIAPETGPTSDHFLTKVLETFLDNESSFAFFIKKTR